MSREGRFDERAETVAAHLNRRKSRGGMDGNSGLVDTLRRLRRAVNVYLLISFGIGHRSPVYPCFHFSPLSDRQPDPFRPIYRPVNELAN